MFDFITKLKNFLPVIFLITVLCGYFIFKFCLTVVEKERDAAIEQRNDAILKATDLQSDINKQNAAIKQLKKAYIEQVERIKKADKLSQQTSIF